MLDMFQLNFMVNALIASVIIGLLLSYLGIHVVGRGIVFVDLALGQISSLGVAFAQFLRFGEIWLPIVFTLVGAFLLSFIHIRDRRLKLEAIIGIIYVVASAVTVLIISKTPHGEANIQEVLFGALLAVTPEEIRNLLIVFGLLGLLHFVFQKHIFRITKMLEFGELEEMGWKERGLNFFFYMSIGLAIVFAVEVGGVLPVFSYLVVPAVSAVMVGIRKWVIIVLALLNSVVAGFFGLWFSYTFDYPAGPSIVAIFGVIFIIAVLVRYLRRKWFRISFETELQG
ncbi:MAG: metal ABC transporter permease [candidate division KSB1 bacterium]|nr:metal ABC transporter permease [candidate division KSB1 bacterium]MDQ7065145.1 metal ABC transporter permease [candidate division KSB1 bacterium]